MFTYEDVKRAFDDTLKMGPSKFVFEERNYLDFQNPSFEENIEAVVGEKPLFSNLMVFWIKAMAMMLKDDCQVAYLKGDYKIIDQTTFDNLITDYKRSLTKPLKHSYNFTKHYVMRNEWNDIILMAENDQVYYLFNWWTSA
ncbi:MAG: hypothetical protein MRY83_14935 [Flavobacteriales bacterium]|nr:hypothetical protein [Flavobacteriales bacterium]